LISPVKKLFDECAKHSALKDGKGLSSIRIERDDGLIEYRREDGFTVVMSREVEAECRAGSATSI